MSAVSVAIPSTLIAAIVFTLVLTVALPVGLMLWLKRRGGRWSMFFVGAATFVVSALVLESLLHALVLNSPLGIALTGNIWLYALYGGFAAGVFEETGRFAVFRLLRNKQTKPVTALACGAGHGGIEAFLIVGLTMVSNLALLVMAADGEPMDSALQAAADTLLSTAPSMFLWAAFERVIAIAFHMACSVLVFAAVNRPGKGWLFPLAILLHMGTDCLAVVSNAYLPVAATELLVMVYTLLVVLLASRVYRTLKAPSDAPAE